jgi:hypothetical protein
MLVITDLQELYLKEFLEKEAEWDLFLSRLESRVKKSIDSFEVIVNLTTELEGITIPAVLEMFNNYPLKFGVNKKDFDGSTELSEFIERKQFSPGNIELCGAYKDVCILETWKGLKSKGFKVLPVQEDLVIETSDNWREINVYPEGFLQPRDKEKPRKSSQSHEKNI